MQSNNFLCYVNLQNLPDDIPSIFCYQGSAHQNFGAKVDLQLCVKECSAVQMKLSLSNPCYNGGLIHIK